MHEALCDSYGREAELEGLMDDIHALESIAHGDVSSDTLGVRPWAVWLVHLGAMGWGSVTARDDKRESTVCSQGVQGMDQLWLDLVAPRF